MLHGLDAALTVMAFDSFRSWTLADNNPIRWHLSFESIYAKTILTVIAPNLHIVILNNGQGRPSRDWKSPLRWRDKRLRPRMNPHALEIR